MSENHPFEVKKSKTGKHQVHYACLNCGVALHNPIEQAGRQDECPECGLVFVVPGSDAREWLRERRVEGDRKQREQERSAALDRTKKRAPRRETARERLTRAHSTIRRTRGPQNSPFDEACFKRYWMPGWIRGMWVISIVIACIGMAVGVVGFVIDLVHKEPKAAFLGLGMAALGTALWLLITRLWLEMIGALFDMLRELRRLNHARDQLPSSASLEPSEG